MSKRIFFVYENGIKILLSNDKIKYTNPILNIFEIILISLDTKEMLAIMSPIPYNPQLPRNKNTIK